jgi:phage shock protein A
MAKPLRYPSETCLDLKPDAAAHAAIDATLATYTELLAWLDATIPASQSADLVSLHRLAYEPARARFDLPAQLVTLGLRDWTRRRRGAEVEGIPLDEKLFAVRGISNVSLATVRGRIAVPFRVEGYRPGWNDVAMARLVVRGGGFQIRVASPLPEDFAVQPGETSMATETVLARIGRVIAGMAHGAIDQAEKANPTAVLEQALREIDQAADEVKLELGRATAERHRIHARRSELASELADLDGKIKIALGGARDDLAEAGIERQLDIEAQVKVLDTIVGDVDQRIAQLNETLDAVKASRREAEQRIADLEKASNATAGSGTGVRTTAADKVERAESAIRRVTGVPAGPGPSGKAVDELHSLARQHAVKERMARLKAGGI